MGKRPISLLKRAQQNEPRLGKKQKTQAAAGTARPQQQRQAQSQGDGGSGGGQRPAGSSKQPAGLRPTSPVHSQAAYAVRRLLEADASKRGGVSLKSLTLAPHIAAKKATYAVTCEALKRLSILQQLLEQTQLLEQCPDLTQAVAYVLVFEMMFGEGLRPTGPAERAVLQRKAGAGPWQCGAAVDTIMHEARRGMQCVLPRRMQLDAILEAVVVMECECDDGGCCVAFVLQADMAQALQQLLDAAGVQQASELLPQPGPNKPHPRTARVNALKMSVQEALDWLRQPPAEHRKWAAVGQLAEPDDLLPDLLVFPPRTDLHDHPLVASGALVLQSKASCMPAHALRPQPGWVVVDACAAPGNKTTHLASLMGNRGSIHAFEKDPKRLQRLQHNAAFTGSTIVAAEHADFLTINPEAPQYREVQAVLLDPSCSGSGTAFSRMDFLLPSSADRLKGQAAIDHSDERVEALAQFQQNCILQALRFPALQRLVYSTCSVHARENEGVVGAVLEAAQAGGFQLEDPFPAWHRRGVAGLVAGAEKLVRVDPDEDGTDGFFVALFAKRGSGAGGADEALQQGGGGSGGGAEQQGGQKAPKKKKTRKSSDQK